MGANSRAACGFLSSWGIDGSRLRHYSACSRRSRRSSPVEPGTPLGLARVHGGSMEPTLREGDRLLVRYGARGPPGRPWCARFADGTLAVKRAVERRRRAPARPAGGCSATTRSGGWTPATGAPVPEDRVLAVVVLTRLAAARPCARLGSGRPPGTDSPAERFRAHPRASEPADAARPLDPRTHQPGRSQTMVAVARCPRPAPHGHPHAGDPVFDLHVGGKMEIRSTVALAGPTTSRWPTRPAWPGSARRSRPTRR